MKAQFQLIKISYAIVGLAAFIGLMTVDVAYQRLQSRTLTVDKDID